MVEISTEKDIESSVAVLKNGGVILYPTDTIWGLGCDATNASAVNKVLEIKGRSHEKAFIVLVDSIERMRSLVQHLPEKVVQHLKTMKHPVTYVLSGGKNVVSSILAGDGSLAVRYTTDAFCRQLIKRLDAPLVSTSANVSGQPAPSFFKQIQPDIIQQADYCVHFRQSDENPRKPSVLIRVMQDGHLEILRS